MWTPKEWRKIRTADKSDADYLAYVLSQCAPSPTGCLVWQGCCGPAPRNYGQTSYRCKRAKTHRLVWALTHGPIPDGMVVMHECDNPPCCNVAHMKLGTHLENMADCREKDRYYYANMTHCKRGHEFTEQNTYLIPTPGEAFGLRRCRACQLGFHRIRAGWPEDLAYSLPPGPNGYRPDFKTT